MSQSFTIEFEDGSSKEIPLLPHVIVAEHSGKKSLEFRETDKGWALYLGGKDLLDGKKLKGVKFDKYT